MRSVFTCALLTASAFAVKQAYVAQAATTEPVAADVAAPVAAPVDTSNEAGTKTESEGFGGQTTTSYSYEIENLDDVQDEIAGFYNDEAKPFIEKHREAVYQAALAEAEEKFGALLETCDEGTKCREDILADMRITMKTQWATILTEFKTNVSNAVSSTRRTVEEGWKALVVCEQENQCCGYSETEWNNNQTEIYNWNSRIQESHDKWWEFERKLVALEMKCPDVVFPSCPSADRGACWDGSSRQADCSCEVRNWVDDRAAAVVV